MDWCHLLPLLAPQHGTCPVLAPDVNFEEVSRLCDNFSGADCDQLVYLASKEAIREVIHASSSSSPTSSSVGKRLVARRHFSAALRKMKPSISAEVSMTWFLSLSCLHLAFPIFICFCFFPSFLFPSLTSLLFPSSSLLLPPCSSFPHLTFTFLSFLTFHLNFCTYLFLPVIFLISIYFLFLLNFPSILHFSCRFILSTLSPSSPLLPFHYSLHIISLLSPTLTLLFFLLLLHHFVHSLHRNRDATRNSTPRLRRAGCRGVSRGCPRMPPPL